MNTWTVTWLATNANLEARVENDTSSLQELEKETRFRIGERLKYGCEAMATVLHYVIVKIWDEKALSDEWIEELVYPTYKEVDGL